MCAVRRIIAAFALLVHPTNWARENATEEDQVEAFAAFTLGVFATAMASVTLVHLW